MGNSFQTQRTSNSSLVWGSHVRWCQWCLPPSVSLTMICRQPQGLLWMLLTVLLTCSPWCTLSCSLSICQITTMKLWFKTCVLFASYQWIRYIYPISGGNIYRYMPHAFKHIYSISHVAICLDKRTASVTQGETTVYKPWPDTIKTSTWLVSMWVAGWSVSQLIGPWMHTCVLT